MHPNRIDTMLREFHTAVAEKYRENGLTALAEAVDVDQDFSHAIACLNLRSNLIDEESNELQAAIAEGDPEQIVKESCDVIYVVVALFALFGWDFMAAFNRVHENNMLKITNGSIRQDGKLLKAPDHPKVNLKDLVEN